MLILIEDFKTCTVPPYTSKPSTKTMTNKVTAIGVPAMQINDTRPTAFLNKSDEMARIRGQKTEAPSRLPSFSNTQPGQSCTHRRCTKHADVCISERAYVRKEETLTTAWKIFADRFDVFSLDLSSETQVTPSVPRRPLYRLSQKYRKFLSIADFLAWKARKWSIPNLGDKHPTFFERRERDCFIFSGRSFHADDVDKYF